MEGEGALTGQSALLAWCQGRIEPYEGVSVADFDASWRDGLAVTALLHSCLPASGLDYEAARDSIAAGQSVVSILEEAFAAAREAGIPSTPDAAGWAHSPDATLLLPFLSQVYHMVQQRGEAAQRGASEGKGRGEGEGDGRPSITLVVGEVCGACGEALAGASVQAMDKHFHEACFCCTECKTSLTGGAKVMKVRDLPYCRACGSAAFSSMFRIGVPGGGTARRQEAASPRSTIKEDLADENQGEARPLDHSTLRARPLGPSGRRGPRRRPGAAARIGTRYNTERIRPVAAAAPAKKQKRKRGRKKKVAVINTDEAIVPLVATQAATSSPKAAKKQKKVRHVPPKKPLPRTPPQKALPPTPPPKRPVPPPKRPIPPPKVPLQPEEPTDAAPVPEAEQASQEENLTDERDEDIVDVQEEDELSTINGLIDRRPSVSDCLSNLKQQQREREDVRRQARMSVWEKSRREELAAWLDQKADYMAGVTEEEPTLAEDSGEVVFLSDAELEAQRVWDEQQEELRKKRAEEMRERKAKRDLEVERRKTKELTAIRRRLAELDEMDDVALEHVLDEKVAELAVSEEDESNAGVEAEEVEDVITFNYEDVVPSSVEGFLQLASISAKVLQPRWKTMWFHLQEDTLVYYSDKQQNVCARDNPPVGVVSLSSVSEMELSGDDAEEKTFCIVAPQRTLLLAADSAADASVWLKSLREAKRFFKRDHLLHSGPVGKQDDSERSGWLEKLGRFNKWNRRWFVLRDGILFRYKEQDGGGELLSQFPLFNTELREYRPEKLTKAFQLQDTRGNEMVLRAADEEEMHAWRTWQQGGEQRMRQY